MFSYRPIIYLISIIVMVLSSLMIIPVLVNYAFDEVIGNTAFLFAFFCGIFTGGSLFIVTKEDKFVFTRRHMFIFTPLCWIIVPAYVALPFLYQNFPMSYTDAFFESMSGLTSCGASVIDNFTILTKGLLIWRSMLNWIGGIGIIAFAIAVLPVLKTGGMQLFHLESSDSSDKVLPNAKQFSAAILCTYIMFTGIIALALYQTNISIFDSISFALTSISTGGFANYSDSISVLNNVPAEIITIFAMILGGIPFTLWVQISLGKWKNLLYDEQVRGFIICLIAICFVIVSWLYYTSYYNLVDSLRFGIFNAVSFMTTTGFTNSNYSQWPVFTIMVLMMATMISACTGSTAGGIKIFRLQILSKITKNYIYKLTFPNGVFALTFNKNIVNENIVVSILTYFFIFIVTLFACALLLSMGGLDFITSISAAIGSITNSSFSIGMVNISGAFGAFSDFSKWILAFTMLLGRLECVVILVVMSPIFWKCQTQDNV